MKANEAIKGLIVISMENHQTTFDDLGCDKNHFKR
jgi:hypothetical protein